MEDGQDFDIADSKGEEGIHVAITDEDGNELYEASFDRIDDDGGVLGDGDGE